MSVLPMLIYVSPGLYYMGKYHILKYLSDSTIKEYSNYVDNTTILLTQ